jgi:hypothetical protein
VAWTCLRWNDFRWNAQGSTGAGETVDDDEQRGSSASLANDSTSARPTE